MDYPKRSRSSDDDSHDFKRQRIADPGRPSKSLTLENGLKVFVFSGGEDVEVSSAAMTVRVGSFADPLEIPGLDHVIEHILFRGSQKFSSVNELQDYVAKYDGGTNAHTEFDHTTFSFEVDPEHFHGALDRFSHLFINPLMETEKLEHEIDAMDSEFLLIKYSDADRLDQILAHTSYEDHPFKYDPGRPSKSLTLENGLKVFVFSGGEDVEVSSAAMTVRVGSFADPLEIPGLAHVIEHILFRGSQKFSSVNELQDYVAKYDGGTNGHTEFDHTTFSFEVDPEHFHGALDRFSHLFINPLMETEKLEHEIDAMDSGTNTLQTNFS
ncbi:unnamed protein product [Arabidopsis arenosa]|uniref:Peptidase M16 N-terminal domain-containing protein n=1 Tax=Arabidopsis arenosa TaxID=38785 RepID=A0A8S1ZPF8_ARAAE|nr:unnamed protein product [Arabidopsis arenosa]